jgi:hypothetical protein
MEKRQEIIGRLKELTRHKYLKLTNCCNSAILLSLMIAKNRGADTVLIPDQGGWLTYQTFPAILGLKTVEIKTDYGLLDLKDLEKKASAKTVLIIASLAGYIAPQPLREISELCRKKGCLLIEDASGAIAEPTGFGQDLCNGNYSDIIVASFGKWKPVNLEYGGFISSNSKEYLELDSELLLTFKFHESFLPKLDEKLNAAPGRIIRLRNICEKIKADLKDFQVIHKNQPGLNVTVKFRTPDEKEKIINYCRKCGYQYTTCPRYIRVLDDAISIEVKRLDI